MAKKSYLSTLMPNEEQDSKEYVRRNMIIPGYSLLSVLSSNRTERKTGRARLDEIVGALAFDVMKIVAIGAILYGAHCGYKAYTGETSDTNDRGSEVNVVEEE